MPKGEVLLLPISGLLGHVVKELYDVCKKRLPEDFPQLKIAFVGTPFPKAPHPLLAEKQRGQNPEAVMLRSWGRFMDFTINDLLPALRVADIVFTRRLGLDIPLFASQCEKWDKNRIRALGIHHTLVRDVLVGKFGFRVPDAYIIPHAENGVLERILRETFPELTRASSEQLNDFLDRQRRVMAEYFDERTGQNRPLFVDAGRSIDEMYTDVFNFVRKRLELYQ